MGQSYQSRATENKWWIQSMPPSRSHRCKAPSCSLQFAVELLLKGATLCRGGRGRVVQGCSYLVIVNTGEASWWNKSVGKGFLSMGAISPAYLHDCRMTCKAEGASSRWQHEVRKGEKLFPLPSEVQWLGRCKINWQRTAYRGERFI